MPIHRIDTNSLMSMAVIHGDTVYVAGQVALENPEASLADQTRIVLSKIDAILKKAGSSKRSLLNASIWLTDIARFPEMNAVWAAWLPEGAAPARATVGAQLALPGLCVEIAVIAALEKP
ncbi:RidA family protein [Niveispirillum sp. KHB5.9]|uniref:RidA family protein n=1 Tax=Niveispirillum sp. KHB5.9 TaxID=3400269 RepID=UPI003A880E12